VDGGSDETLRFGIGNREHLGRGGVDGDETLLLGVDGAETLPLGGDGGALFGLVGSSLL